MTLRDRNQGFPRGDDLELNPVTLHSGIHNSGFPVSSRSNPSPAFFGKVNMIMKTVDLIVQGIDGADAVGKDGLQANVNEGHRIGSLPPGI
jgi:hypothetical protein